MINGTGHVYKQHPKDLEYIRYHILPLHPSYFHFLNFHIIYFSNIWDPNENADLKIYPVSAKFRNHPAHCQFAKALLTSAKNWIKAQVHFIRSKHFFITVCSYDGVPLQNVFS